MDRDKPLDTPRRSSSSMANKRSSSEKAPSLGEDKKKRDRQKDDGTLQGGCVSPPSLAVAGPSREVNTAPRPADRPSRDEQLDRLSSVISGLIAKLDGTPAARPPFESCPDFSGFTVVSSGDEEGEIPESVSDPLEGLDAFGGAESTHPDAESDKADFLKALGELSNHFHGEEEKGEPLADCLANILNASLRRRPTSEGVKSTSGKIKLPSNVPNLTVPATNKAITSAMSFAGKLIDTRLFLTNGLLTKAIVPVAQCISDVGEGKGKTVSYYLEGLNNSLRLLSSAVNYVNQLRKDVARMHVNDSALADLCKWECEVGREDLFPFDVTKKCEEIRKTRKLGKPPFRPTRIYGPRRFAPYGQAPGRPYHPQQSRPRSTPRPFLGQRPPQGKGARPHKTRH